jgi:hypothetical protein
MAAGADQFEQHAGFSLILVDVGDVIEDQQVILVEFGERAFEGEFAARDLQADEQHPPSVVDEGEPPWRPPGRVLGMHPWPSGNCPRSVLI